MSTIIGTLENWSIAKQGKYFLFFGNIYNDTRGRWPPGTWMHTSRAFPIEGEFKKGSVVTTLNSIYLLGEPGPEFNNDMLTPFGYQPLNIKPYDIGK